MAEKARANEKSVFMLYCSVMVSRIDPDFWIPDRPMNPALLQMLLVSCLHSSAFEAMERHDAESRQTVLLWDLTKRHSVPLDKELCRVANAMVYGPDQHVQYPWKIFLRMVPSFQLRTSFPAAKSTQNPQEVHLEQIKWARHEAKAFLKEFGGAAPIHLALIEAIFDEPKMAGFLCSSASKSLILQAPDVHEQQNLQQQQKMYNPMGPKEQHLIPLSPPSTTTTTSAQQPRQTFRTRSELAQQQTQQQQQMQPNELTSSAPLYRTSSSFARPGTFQTLQSQRAMGGEPAQQQGEFISQ